MLTLAWIYLSVALGTASGTDVLFSTLDPTSTRVHIIDACGEMDKQTSYRCVSTFDRAAFCTPKLVYSSYAAESAGIAVALSYFESSLSDIVGQPVNMTYSTEVYQDSLEGVLYPTQTSRVAQKGDIAIAYTSRILLQAPTYGGPVVNQLQLAPPYHLAFLNSEQRAACKSPQDSFAFSHTGNGVRIYVVGCGVSDHVEFTSRTREGTRLSSDRYVLRNAFKDVCANWQGTHVAALAAGITYGVAKDASIVSVAVTFGCRRNTGLSSLAEGLQWILQHSSARPGRSVVLITANASIKLPDPSAVTLIEGLVQRLVDRGLVVVTAAGDNEADSCAFTPGRLDSVITTAAAEIIAMPTKTVGKPWRLTNFGKCVDIWAPGDKLESAFPGEVGLTASISGTGQAAALVAGACATVLEEFPHATPAFVKERVVNMSSQTYMMYSLLDTAGGILQQRSARYRCGTA